MNSVLTVYFSSSFRVKCTSLQKNGITHVKTQTKSAPEAPNFKIFDQKCKIRTQRRILI